MLLTPATQLIADAPIVDGEHLRHIQAGGRKELHEDPGDFPADIRAADGEELPPASCQWNHAMADGDLFKGGFVGQGPCVSPARDLVIAFAGTPRADGSVNLLRWFRRRIATHPIDTV
jgi:hypothetical protein